MLIILFLMVASLIALVKNKLYSTEGSSRARKKIEFQHVIWASSFCILLAGATSYSWLLMVLLEIDLPGPLNVTCTGRKKQNVWDYMTDFFFSSPASRLRITEVDSTSMWQSFNRLNIDSYSYHNKC